LRGAVTSTWSPLCQALPVQFSLFGAAAAEPVLDDLDGVLLAGGHWARLGGTARLSIVVADAWRADALSEAFARRGVAEAARSVEAAQNGTSVRTAFSAALAPYANRWAHGANQAPPVGFALTPGGLRMWAIAAGRRDDAGYVLGTSGGDDAAHLAAGAQLARLGLAATSLKQRPGPGWRITSVKRLRRLAEVVGEPVDGAGRDWPC
jgi:hypothetical protein